MRWIALLIVTVVAAMFLLEIIYSPATLRTWLETNKIFFDIGAAIALALMGIVLAYQGNRISERQTALAERQTLVAEEQLRPRLRFEIEENSGEYGDILTAKNEGGPLNSYTFYHMAFLGLSLRKLAEPIEEEVLWVPFYFFGERDVSGNSQGDIFRAFNRDPEIVKASQRMHPAPRSTEELLSLEKRLREYLPSCGLKLQHLEMRHYVEVNYNWSLGSEVDSFHVRSFRWEGLPAQRLKGQRVVSPNISAVTFLTCAKPLESPESFVKAIPRIRELVIPPPDFWNPSPVARKHGLPTRMRDLLRRIDWRKRCLL